MNYTVGKPTQNEREKNDPNDLHFPIFWPDCGCAAHVFRESDAHLFAAAPELRDTLKAILPYVEDLCDEGPQSEPWQSEQLLSVISAARNAIAKATNHETQTP